jgi:Ca2+-binding EF-hand superfamily protein
MRRSFLLLAFVLAAPAAAQPPAAEGGENGPPRFHRPHGGVFLSPMGEPFRSQDPAADNVGTWFAQADIDHDGALTLDEIRRDADRFFQTLDTNHDGEIDPAETSRYETEIAPEVQVGMQMRGEGGRPWGFGGGRRGGGHGGWGGRHGGGGEGRGGGEGGGGSERSRPNGGFDEGLEGAGRFSFINIPEPVISADADLNRGVSRAEFAAAAGQRFLMLDTNHDGRITRAELPPLPQRHAGKVKQKKGDHIRRPEGIPLPD